MNWVQFASSAAEVARVILLPKQTANVDIRVLDFTSVKDGVMWTINEVTARSNSPIWRLGAGETRRVIVCNTIRQDGKHWGYEQSEETFHPYCYSCPLEYLESVPAASDEWRDKVRLFHTERSCIPDTFCSYAM